MDKVRILMTDDLVERMPEITSEKYPEESARIEWVLAKSGNEEELSRLVKGAHIIVGARNRITSRSWKMQIKQFLSNRLEKVMTILILMQYEKRASLCLMREGPVSYLSPNM